MVTTTALLTIVCAFLFTQYFEQRKQQVLAAQAQSYLKELLSLVNTEEEKLNVSTWSARDPKAQFSSVSDEILKINPNYLGVELRDDEGLLVATKLKAHMSPAWYSATREIAPPNIQLNITKAANLRKTVWTRSYTPSGERVIEALVPSKDGRYIWQVFFSDSLWLPPLSNIKFDPSMKYKFIDPSAYTSNSNSYTAKLLLYDLEDFLLVQNILEENNSQVFFSETSLTVSFLTVLLLLLLLKYFSETKKNIVSQLTINNQSQILDQQAKMSNLTEISTSLAHELNQPLASIVNYVATSEILLNQAGFSDKKVLDLLQKARLQSLRAGEVIQSIKNLLKSEKQELETVDLNRLIERVRPILQATTNDLSCKLQIQCPPQTKVRAVPLLLELVVLNLVKNAAESMQGNQANDKTVSVKIRTVKNLTTDKNNEPKISDHVRIDVVDKGTGINAAYAGQLFTSFFTTKSHGMGMGLKLCRTVAESFGGHMRWANNDDTGATFSLILPLPKGKA